MEWLRGTVRDGFRTLQLQIDDDRFLPAADNNSFARLVGESIDFLMRHVRGNINEVTRPGFSAEFQTVSPPHACAAANDVKNGLQFPMVMRTRLGVRLHHHRTRPQLTRTRPGVSDSGSTRHSGRLWRIQVQIACCNDLDTVVLPVHSYTITLVDVLRDNSGRRAWDAAADYN